MSNKTLLLTLDFPPNKGGVARYLGALAEYFSDRLFVIAPPTDQSETPHTFSLFHQPLLCRYAWPRWLCSVWILWKKRKDYTQVLVSHLLPLGTAAWTASWFTRKPYLLVLHGMDFRLALCNPYKRLITRIVLSQATCVIVNSDALAKEVQSHFTVKHLEVVYPCVDPVFLKDHLKENRSSTTLRLLTVSRLVSRKGHALVLQALAQLKKEGLLIEYAIYGDGPEEQTLKQFVIAEQLEENVHFYSCTTDEQILEAYRHADLFVMPVLDDQQDKEGFGMVYIEAAAQGLPAIATRMSGVDEAVIDQETGILIPSGDVNALCEAIKDLFFHPDKRLAMGERAKQRVRSEFVADKQFKKLASFL